MKIKVLLNDIHVTFNDAGALPLATVTCNKLFWLLLSGLPKHRRILPGFSPHVTLDVDQDPGQTEKLKYAMNLHL